MMNIVVAVIVAALVALLAFPLVSKFQDWQESGLSFQDWMKGEEQEGEWEREYDLIERNSAPLYRRGNPGTMGGGTRAGGYLRNTGFEQLNAGQERSSQIKALSKQVQVSEYLGGGAGRIAGTAATLAPGQTGVYGGTVSSLRTGKLQ